MANSPEARGSSWSRVLQRSGLYSPAHDPNLAGDVNANARQELQEHAHQTSIRIEPMGRRRDRLTRAQFLKGSIAAGLSIATGTTLIELERVLTEPVDLDTANHPHHSVPTTSDAMNKALAHQNLDGNQDIAPVLVEQEGLLFFAEDKDFNFLEWDKGNVLIDLEAATAYSQKLGRDFMVDFIYPAFIDTTTNEMAKARFAVKGGIIDTDNTKNVTEIEKLDRKYIEVPLFTDGSSPVHILPILSDGPILSPREVKPPVLALQDNTTTGGIRVISEDLGNRAIFEDLFSTMQSFVDFYPFAKPTFYVQDMKDSFTKPVQSDLKTAPPKNVILLTNEDLNNWKEDVFRQTVLFKAYTFLFDQLATQKNDRVDVTAHMGELANRFQDPAIAQMLTKDVRQMDKAASQSTTVEAHVFDPGSYFGNTPIKDPSTPWNPSEIAAGLTQVVSDLSLGAKALLAQIDHTDHKNDTDPLSGKAAIRYLIVPIYQTLKDVNQQALKTKLLYASEHESDNPDWMFDSSQPKKVFTLQFETQDILPIQWYSTFPPKLDALTGRNNSGSNGAPGIGKSNNTPVTPGI